MRDNAEAKEAKDPNELNHYLYKLFAEINSEKYKSPSEIIHSVLVKLNEQIFMDEEKN